MWIILFVIVVLIGGSIFFILHEKKRYLGKIKAMQDDFSKISAEHKTLTVAVDELEAKIAHRFFFYDIVRSIDPILDKNKLLTVFVDELRRCGMVNDACLSNFPKEGYLVFSIRGDDGELLLVRPKTKDAVGYMPALADVLALCIERISLYERLQRLSIYDSLTGAYNRRYFMTRYDDEFSRAAKYKLSLSLLIIDLDHFKQINDTYGHLSGDMVLKKVSSMIRESIREVDFSCRFGGEEFAVVLSETDKAGVLMVAERIRVRISSENIIVFEDAIKVTASIGVACYPDNTIQSDMLIELADKMLYQAKKSGRNIVASL